MGAVPKRKVSSMRRGNRRAHQKIALPALVRCTQCRSFKLRHHVCPTCGTYRGMQIIEGKLAAQ
ncbi:MAG TPA: 50S ribosomal protein L32 [Chloroflexota bacterium]|jgi:large subunit ribosomal protein L32|nr:50S ribosomal protein L32 [Chloroflexota bacterium]